MKPVEFDYARPRDIAEAITMLARNPAAKVMAGGQTLGPMLNMRFAQPDLVVDIRDIVELKRLSEGTGAVTFGACTTHAAFEDGKVPDPSKGMLQRVASRIAYRAVRTRGTMGGSLAHADPAADWVSTLTALDAEISIASPRGQRRIPMTSFMRGVMETAVEPDELLECISVPHLTSSARWGYHKICRKTGEFAEAIGAVVIDKDRCRLVAGATTGRPIVVDISAADAARGIHAIDIASKLSEAGLDGDFYEQRLHVVAVRRALEEALTC